MKKAPNDYHNATYTIKNYEAKVLYLRQNAKMPQYYCCVNKISPIAASYWKSPDSLFRRNWNLKIPTDIHLWVNHLRKN